MLPPGRVQISSCGFPSRLEFFAFLVDVIAPLLGEQNDDNPMFNQLSFERWLKQRRVPLLNESRHFLPGDERKFCEQMGDILEWDQSNKNYIPTQGVSQSIGGFTRAQGLCRFLISI